MAGDASKVVLPMVIATGGVLIGGAVGGPKSNRSNLGVFVGAFIAIFILLLLNEAIPTLAQGIAILAALSSLLIYGPHVAKAVNSVR